MQNVKHLLVSQNSTELGLFRNRDWPPQMFVQVIVPHDRFLKHVGKPQTPPLHTMQHNAVRARNTVARVTHADFLEMFRRDAQVVENHPCLFLLLRCCGQVDVGGVEVVRW